MTQKEFEARKTWLEKVANVDFGEDAKYKPDEFQFEHYIDADMWVVVYFTKDECSVYVHAKTNVIEIYRADIQNAHICADIFSHIIHWN